MNTLSNINGIDTDALRGAIDAITLDPAKGATHWQVASHWRGGTRSDALVTSCSLGGQRLQRNFTIKVDEPNELCGTNQFANPQEYLLAALNACMIVGYTVLCSFEGIELEELRIETEGDIDLRGFLGISDEVKPGYDQLRYTVHIKGNGTPEQFEQIHRAVMTRSPNYYNLSNAVPLKSRLVLENR
jgi:uncharacterized OsmC-like protein